MPSIKLEIIPLRVPDTVVVKIPGGELVEIDVKELDDEMLASLIEEFSTNLLAAAGK
jgi:hypothetical protein